MKRATRKVVHQLGASEQMIDLDIYRNPVQFSLVAELDHPVSAEDLAHVLAVLQHRHPVLGGAVDRAGPEAVSRVSGGVIPIEVAADGTPCEYVVDAEQARPIPPASEPPARAVLVPGDSGCAVVLTVAHQVIDEASGPQTVLDLVTALGGRNRPDRSVATPDDAA